MFNIQENENETTGNYDLIDMKAKMAKIQSAEAEQTGEEAKDSKSTKVSRRNTLNKKSFNVKRNPSKIGARESIRSYEGISDNDSQQ